MAVKEFLVLSLNQKLLNLRLVLGSGSMPREQEAFNFTASGGSLAPFVDLPLIALIHLTKNLGLKPRPSRTALC
ncbi:MAG: hypothetical protein JGK17_17145 [Microcoleus sp. PH2017_10_PVI_O_A]|uniref:hypothetical protein n=1 Tax=unclassified Microcoleus TaxID=2642155 RepID=UPI001D501CE4|nr:MULTISPECIES: hypothetical protein [unclassified Microcoleus]MCC3407286.1 hypothetical protein [Microcoleus sp. PH2017_10_PVI_O_A]MCC3461362.1 hypothetical protein [Microcoleus sp. PH2017_11_PCY_U_A]MCC3479817.1 hypothetical protein [Microcoleus sp. PH2017_12_PCY_D_A]MCC3530514.1 hypothetical protein [Microcoleus sp. PH2017_21_RUC_O_A]MCC3542836.1 hypothetical protein [Microcoleus sp. PH2017_22_RUC_O_B]